MVRTNSFLILLLLGVLVGGLSSCRKDSSGSSAHPRPLSLLPTETLTVGSETFTVELAYTRQSRAKGLMFRQSLDPDAGMLFIFAEPAVQEFYMKNCLIDLDILFIKSDGQIAAITTMKAPKAGERLIFYSSGEPVQYALELPAGTAQRLHLQPGQNIQLPPRVRQITAQPD